MPVDFPSRTDSVLVSSCTMPLDNSEMALEEVLQTYSSVKGHRTRCEREIKKLTDSVESAVLLYLRDPHQ